MNDSIDKQNDATGSATQTLHLKPSTQRKKRYQGASLPHSFTLVQQQVSSVFLVVEPSKIIFLI